MASARARSSSGTGDGRGGCPEAHPGAPSSLAPGRSAASGLGWPRLPPESDRDPHCLDRSDGVPDLHHASEPVPAARPDDLPAASREGEPEVRGPTRGDVGDGAGEPDAPPRLGRAILPEPQGTGTDEDIDAGIARLGRALNRVALDEDATIEPDALHPRIPDRWLLPPLGAVEVAVAAVVATVAEAQRHRCRSRRGCPRRRPGVV